MAFPLGAVGLAAGLVMASTVFPDGCAFQPDQAIRLQWGLSTSTPLFLLVLGSPLGRYAAPARRWRWALVAALACTVCFSVHAAVECFLYDGPRGILEWPAAMAFFGPEYAALLLVAAWMVGASRRYGGEPRADAPGARQDRALWRVALVAIPAIAALVYGVPRLVDVADPLVRMSAPLVEPLAFAAWLATLAAVGGLLWLVRRATAWDAVALAVGALLCAGAYLAIVHAPHPEPPPASIGAGGVWRGC